MEAVRPPKIDDPDALDRMARVEGERWKAHQLANKTSSTGFFAYLMAWDAIVKAGEVGEITPHMALGMDVVPGVKAGDGAIYGEAGYTRYYVRRDGTITFDYSLARKEKQDMARMEGFPPG